MKWEVGDYVLIGKSIHKVISIMMTATYPIVTYSDGTTCRWKLDSFIDVKILPKTCNYLFDNQ